MRIMPFMKRKKGIQFAGAGLDTGGGGQYVLQPATSDTLGGIKVGQGLSVASDGTLSAEGGGCYAISTTEVKTNFTFMGDNVYCKAYNISVSSNIGSGSLTFTSGETQIKKLIDSSFCIEHKIGNVYAPEVIKGYINVTPNYGEVRWVGTSAYNIASSDWKNGVLILYYTKNS